MGVVGYQSGSALTSEHDAKRLSWEGYRRALRLGSPIRRGLGPPVRRWREVGEVAPFDAQESENRRTDRTWHGLVATPDGLKGAGDEGEGRHCHHPHGPQVLGSRAALDQDPRGVHPDASGIQLLAPEMLGYDQPRDFHVHGVAPGTR